MARSTVVVALVLQALLGSAPAARAQDEASAAALRRWSAAVFHHQPGSPDASAAFVASLTYDHRLELNPAMEFFLDVLRGEVRAPADAAHRAIVDLGDAVRRDPGVEPFIRRAAMLHTDAAVFAARLPLPEATGRSTATGGRSRRQTPTPLISTRSTVMQIDGRIVGQSQTDWNWGFARYLLDLLMPSAGRSTVAGRDFVAAWYHAADAYLMASGNLAELRPQLDRAGTVLPEDARVLFDRACYVEAFGLPYNQALRDDPLRHARGVDVDIPSQSAADREAEALFHRVVAIDAGYGEARVRLARLLERNGQYAEAAAETSRALSRDSDRVVGYLAHLVAGRAASALGHPADALEHYTNALSLFPDAQSALVGASQAAVMVPDVAAAVSFAQRLGARSRVLAADPWWRYRLGAGRDARALLEAVWQRADVDPRGDK